MSFPHVILGKYLTFAVLYAAGASVRDIREKYYAHEQQTALREGTDVYPLMLKEAAEKETDLIVLPHPEGSGTPDMNTSDCGVIYGLRLSTTRGEILRAKLEGLSFDMRKNLECLKECGLQIDHIVAAGGGTKSDATLAIRVDALGHALALPLDPQAGTRGVYMIAAKSLGWITDYAELSCSIAREITPGGNASAMEKKYRKYLGLCGVLKEFRFKSEG